MVTIKEFVRVRIIEDGKTVSEIRAGDDLCAKEGKWMNKNRTIDRKNDRYLETIIDPGTGEVVHHCDEKLTDHQSHGSAKHLLRLP